MHNAIPYLVNRSSPFPFEGLLGCIFQFYSYFSITVNKQTVENPISCVLRHLVRFCTVCRCPGVKILQTFTMAYTVEYFEGINLPYLCYRITGEYR